MAEAACCGDGLVIVDSVIVDNSDGVAWESCEEDCEAVCLSCYCDSGPAWLSRMAKVPLVK